MAAIRKEQRFAAFQALIDIEISNATSRPLTNTFFQADQYGRPSETIDHS